jgi:type I restriction enzyme S subunit
MGASSSQSEGWRIVQFGDVVRQVKKKVDPVAAGIERYVGGEHMDTDDLRIRRWGNVGDGYLGPAFNTAFVPGQVLYGSRRTYLRKVAVADFEGVCANTTFVLEPSSSDLRREFLPYVMTTEQFHEHSIKQSKGSVNPYINYKDLTWYQFALPPTEEQQRIVEAMATLDEAISAHFEACRAVSRVALSLRSAIAHAGQLHALGELAVRPGGIQIGPFGSQLHAEEYTAGGVPVVMPSDLRNGSLDPSQVRRVSETTAVRLALHRLRENDILLPRRGELNKRAFVGPSQVGWLCGTGTVRVRLQDPSQVELVVEMLSEANSVRWLSENAVGTTMPNLNADIVSRIPLVLPALPSRDAWMTQLSSCRELAEVLKVGVTTQKDLRRALLHRLLKGGSYVQ